MRGSRAWPVVLVGLGLALIADASAAHAEAPRGCIDAVERGQALRDKVKLVEAKAAFLACASSACPEIIQRDCAQWVVEVETRLPTVIVTASDSSGRDVVYVPVLVAGGLIKGNRHVQVAKDTPMTNMMLSLMDTLGVHQAKLGVTWHVTDQWTIGAVVIAQSGQFLFGDEANLTPQLPGFATLNLSTSYQIAPHVQLFGSVENVTDAKYYTFGTFSPTSAVFLAQAPNATNPRAYTPAAPVGAFGGLRVTF